MLADSAFTEVKSSDHGTCADETRTGRKVASISVGGRSRRPHSSPQIKLKQSPSADGRDGRLILPDNVHRCRGSAARRKFSAI